MKAPWIHHVHTEASMEASWTHHGPATAPWRHRGDTMEAPLTHHSLPWIRHGNTLEPLWRYDVPTIGTP